MLQTLMTKLYWIIFSILCVVLVALIFLYIIQVDDFTDKKYYHLMNLKRIVITVAILSSALYFRFMGNQKWANIILYIPVVITILLALGFFIIVFLFSQSGK